MLVEYVEHDGALHAVTLARGRLALHDLGSAADAARELEWLRFALARLARRRDHRRSAEAAAAALDRLLLAPLPARRSAGRRRPDRRAARAALGCAALAARTARRGRALALGLGRSRRATAPATPQDRARRRPAAPPRRGRGARARRDLSGATVLPRATARGGRAALDGAALAHVACHGRLRADSPLFSSLELADGPLTALDLQGLRRAPDVLVLSACDLALSELHAGDELLGFAAALLGMGTRTIVASVVPVPDAAARRLMLAFHRELAAGAAPATALARAPAALRGGAAALQGFVCLGAG